MALNKMFDQKCQKTHQIHNIQYNLLKYATD